MFDPSGNKACFLFKEVYFLFLFAKIDFNCVSIWISRISFLLKYSEATSRVKSSIVGPSPPVSKTYLDLEFAIVSAEKISAFESPTH